MPGYHHNALSLNTSRAGAAAGRRFQKYKNYSYRSLSCLGSCSLHLPFHCFTFSSSLSLSFFLSCLPPFFLSFFLSFFFRSFLFVFVVVFFLFCSSPSQLFLPRPEPARVADFSARAQAGFYCCNTTARLYFSFCLSISIYLSNNLTLSLSLSFYTKLDTYLAFCVPIPITSHSIFLKLSCYLSTFLSCYISLSI